MTTPSYNILQVFNRYLQHGGEEQSVDRIREKLSMCHDLNSCSFQSADWVDADGPNMFSQAARIFYNPSAARKLSKMIKENRPDTILLHNLYPVGSPSLYRTALKFDVPVVQYIHNFRPFSVGGTLWAGGRLCEDSLYGHYWDEVRYGAWQNSVVKSAIFALALKFLHSSGWLDAIRGWIAISNFMRDKFIAAGVDESIIHVLEHAWELQTQSSEEFGDDGYYLFLGRLVAEKGIGVLLDAWKQVCEELGTDAPELWVGGSGPLSVDVQEAAQRSDKVKFLGFVDGDRKRDVIENCRAMIAPSTWWEPLGLVTYEAYDFKKPMFAAASGGLEETVEAGKTGFLHEPGNALELATQVLEFERMPPSDRTAMGREGRRWLETHTNPDDWQEKFDAILGKVLAN
jgi:glycosyltransferase involved in cell wall biosynthesis